MNVSVEHIDEQELDRFEARFFGTMSPEETHAFDEQLITDPEFSKRYRSFELVVKGIMSTRDPREKLDPAELRRRFKEVDRDLDGEHGSRWWLWAAAAVLLICGALWLVQRPSENVKLADEFMLPEPGLPVLMHTSPGAMDAIMNAYKLELFAEADSLLRAALQQDPTNDTLHYFSGVVAEKIQDCTEAMIHYDQLVGTSHFSERAVYRKAICNLRAGHVAEARSGLREVQAARDPQVRQRAVELLERL